MEKPIKIEKIDLNEILKDYQVKDINTFQNYLIGIWGDLARRSSEPSKGIEKLTFSHYYELPGIICERLFSVFDRNQNNFLDPAEFIGGMKILFTQDFSSLYKFIFKFYDFDHDGLISREDVRVVLSYVPLNKKFSSHKLKFEQDEYLDRVESQDELFHILNIAFKDKNIMNFNEYINVIENVNSDIFIFILMFLMEKKPFTNKSIELFVKEKKNYEENEISKTPQIYPHNIASPSLTSKFISPNLKKRTLNIVNKTILSLYSGKNSMFNSDFNRNENESKLIFNSNNDNNKILEKENKKPHRRLRQKLDMLEDKTPKISAFTFSKHEEINDNNNNVDIISDESDDEEYSPPLVTHEGFIYKISHSKKLKKVYFKLIGKDFFYYKGKDDKNHKGMHNLSGIYIKKGDKVNREGKDFYTFSILYPQKERTYYVEDENEFKEWMEKLNLAINYKSLLDQYNIKEKIGKGKFGLVKYGIHKETNRPVAIKIMAKKNMKKQDLELAKTEIDILKICQHPNIVKLYDIFDNSDYIYIVMEYCSGGDLFSYIEKRNYKLNEERAADIIHKLSMAVYYLHSYGIINRDLNPENILMTDESENADIRLLDFGLSKIIGPNEKCLEPFGTLSFVAPEVLKGKPYDKTVDLWSIGIIAYLLLCGFLPFDDEHSEREIARQTIQDPVPFPDHIWDKLSVESKEFVDGLLKKKPEDRISITQVLESKWITKFCKTSEMRMSDENKKGSLFQLYSSDKKI
jgi:Ca2+-binding EF-hand superfamily protein